MRTVSIAIRVLVAVAFAAIGVFGEVWGCVALLGLGILSLIVLHRDRASDVASSQLPRLSHFTPWGVCVVLFTCFVLLLAPLAFPPVVIALLILSPLFGMLVFLVSSAVSSLARRCG